MARLKKEVEEVKDNLEEVEDNPEVIEMGMDEKQIKKTEVCIARYFDSMMGTFVEKDDIRTNFDKTVNTFYKKVK